MTKPKSGKYHWIKWWPRRWRGDPAVQACSLAARGAWREILDIMQIEDAGGYLLVGGEVPDAQTIARLLGCTEREWKSVEAELERRKVFSRRKPDGAIYCRSRVREEGADGEPVGAPEGDPSGDPPDIHRVSDGSPPSRALLSSRPLTSSNEGGSAEGGTPLVLTEADFERKSWEPHLRMHPTLDTPAVRAALDEWEEHLRINGKTPYRGKAWETNFVQWERWGPARLVTAIATTMGANKFTVFEPTRRASTEPIPPEQVPASSGLYDRSRKRTPA